MSGICGAWSLDGGDPNLEPVLALLQRRGPDGTRSWADGPVKLGHALLATTPEAMVEVLPLTDGRSGCTITADVRLDNREELIGALGLTGEERVIGDGELVLRAYLEWGEDCPKHLLGDFAFAIWDPRAPHLFCARDHMGMRQFNYCHIAGKIFAFSTEVTAVLALEGVPKTVDEGHIADFIADLESFGFTSTFFENIRRLPPAHSLTIEPNRSNVRRYWQLRPGPPLRLESDEAFSAALLEVFIEAVGCRLRNAGGLGAMLSGGLDSTAIVAVAARMLSAKHEGPLRTISAVGPDASRCHETKAIQSALSINGLDPTLISIVDFNGLSDNLISSLKEMENPFEIHGTMLRSIYCTAKQHGLRIVLDGGAGDVILTSSNRIADLMSKGRFVRALHEALGEAQFWKPNSPRKFLARTLLSGAWVALVPVPIRLIRKRFQLSKPLPNAEPRFARKIAFANRRRVADKHISMKLKSDPERRAQSILHPNLAAGRERYDQLSGSFGVESRDPFMDIRLIEFCLSLPPEQLQSGGWPKLILRRAVKHMVPQDITWRLGKEHLGSDFTHTLLARWVDWDQGVCDPYSPLRHYISQKVLNDLRDNRKNAPSDLALRLFALDRFLRRFDRFKNVREEA